MHRLGSIILETMLNSDHGGFQGKTIDSDDGYPYEFKEIRDKKILTVLGPLTVKRAYYYNGDNRKGFFPKDICLDISKTSFSPGMRRIMARVGALGPFATGRKMITDLVGVEVNSKEIERISYQMGAEVQAYYESDAKHRPITPSAFRKPIPEKIYIEMDGTGVPVVKKESEGRKGKGDDGQARTREVKLGCVFTQTGLDMNGYPVRDEGSTTYTGAIVTAEEFGDHIYAWAKSCHLDAAKMVVVIGDGAIWIWNIADFHFHGAIQIVDLFHACEHYWNLAKRLFSGNKQALNIWTEKRKKELYAGDVESLIAALRNLTPHTEEDKEAIAKEINYFDKNKERMRYKTFRDRGLFVGSGVIEAGCKSVIGQRLKQSGMHWTVPGADKITALRCCILSNLWDDFWKNRKSA